MSHISVEQVCTMWATEDEFEEEERKNWGVCWLRLVWLTTQQVRILEMFLVCIFSMHFLCMCIYLRVCVYTCVYVSWIFVFYLHGVYIQTARIHMWHKHMYTHTYLHTHTRIQRRSEYIYYAM